MNKLWALIGPAVFIVIWWTLGRYQLIDPLYLPSLGEVWDSLSVISRSGWNDIWATTYRTILGFLIAGGLAIPTGIALGHSNRLYSSLEFIIDFSRSLPAPALFPLALLFFGIGDKSKIAISTFVAFWVILVNTIHGVWSTPKLRIDVGKVFGASKLQVLWRITFFDALPSIFTGLKTGISFALILIVVAEISIGTKLGLGQKIFDSYNTYKIPDLYAYILLTGLLGFVLNWVCRYVEKKTVHWVGK